jgi:hypothetical protein
VPSYAFYQLFITEDGMFIFWELFLEGEKNLRMTVAVGVTVSVEMAEKGMVS